MANQTPTEILDLAFRRASERLDTLLLDSAEISRKIERLARNTQNRAGARFILACALAKQHKPDMDIRKPYTEIGDQNAYSGRTYDETYVTEFVTEHALPCNATTAFLTPAFRNRNVTLTPDLNLVGRPPGVYRDVLQLLDDVHSGRLVAGDLLAEMIRWLLVVRNEKRQRMATLLATLKSMRGESVLSATEIVGLIEQHLTLKRSSRLPVLVVAAAYQAAENHLGEQMLPLQDHHAADKQTGSLGDLEIVLIDDERVVTGYEMKTRRVTKSDIDHAISKIAQRRAAIENYIFITTDVIDRVVAEYATEIYGQTGVEVAILDCVDFLRHFLHLFYRLRMQFLEAYQAFVLAEPESSVGQPLKEAFLTMRQAIESMP